MGRISTFYPPRDQGALATPLFVLKSNLSLNELSIKTFIVQFV